MAATGTSSRDTPSSKWLVSSRDLLDAECANSEGAGEDRTLVDLLEDEASSSLQGSSEGGALSDDQEKLATLTLTLRWGGLAQGASSAL